MRLGLELGEAAMLAAAEAEMLSCGSVNAKGGPGKPGRPSVSCSFSAAAARALADRLRLRREIDGRDGEQQALAEAAHGSLSPSS